MHSEPAKRSPWSWWYLLFLPQFVALLYPPFFNRAEPYVMGVPFFYWYQMLWVVISAVVTAIIYLVTSD